MTLCFGFKCLNCSAQHFHVPPALAVDFLSDCKTADHGASIHQRLTAAPSSIIHHYFCCNTPEHREYHIKHATHATLCSFLK